MILLHLYVQHLIIVNKLLDIMLDNREAATHRSYTFTIACMFSVNAFTQCFQGMRVVSMRVIVCILIITCTGYCKYIADVFITNCSTHVKLYFDHWLHVFRACTCMHSLHVFSSCKLFPCEYSYAYLSSHAQNAVQYIADVFITNCSTHV